MASTLAQAQMHADSARSNFAAGSYTTAIQQAGAALAAYGSLPNTEKGNAKIDINAAVGALRELIALARQLRAESVMDDSGAGIQRTKVRMKRTTDLT